MTDLEYLSEWPAVGGATRPDPALEERVEALLGQMTLEEKVGQMIQPELAELTPEDVTRYKIGSALNGAGIWPDGNRHATRQQWIETVDAYWQAAEDAYAGRGFRVPFLWATDAVHGNNNVYGATIFPHNIGLGAARDPHLLRRIGAATAREIAAAGMDWTFAPTVTTPRDRRWGRYYEGYGEDPRIVHAYAPEMVRGIQQDDPDAGVLACIKHWVADGGTAQGGDRGTARCSEDLLRNVHAAGFLSGIAAGAASVMVSFSSWENPANYDHSPDQDPPYNHKVHGSRYLITDVLKDKVGFDGIVVSDWDAHSEVSGCSAGDAGYAINAGIDVLMIAGREAWQSVHRTTVEHVRAGRIPAERVDDAARRVLRTKMRAGLWERPRPAQRPLAAGTGSGLLGCNEHRALSREAARKSLVLLKHDPGTLPLPRDARVLVTGSGADDIRKLTGGWTLTWQGADLTLDDLPGARTLAGAVADVVGAERTTVDPDLAEADPAAFDVAVAVLGEDSYAEMRGTIKPWGTLGYAAAKRSYARDLDVLRRLRAAGVTTVTVFLSGRPMYTTEEINLSDAFIAAWLPGPEAGGITDLLFRPAQGAPAHDFQGRLGFSWPATPRSHAANAVPPHIPGYRVPPEEQEPTGEHAPLFPVGYGLTLAGTNAPEESAPAADGTVDPVRGPRGTLPLDTWTDPTPVPAADGPLPVPWQPGGPFDIRVGGHNTWSRPAIPFDETTDLLVIRAEPAGTPERPDAFALRFKGYPAFIYAQYADGHPADLRGYADGGRIEFDVRVVDVPDGPLYLACHDDYPAQPGIDLAPRLAALEPGEWTRLSVPVRELAEAGSDLGHVDVPFMLYSDHKAAVDVAAVRWTTP